MKAQLAILKRRKAPVELIRSFQEVCAINDKLNPELRSSYNELLEEQCRKFGFNDVLPDGWFFRPYLLGEGFRRKDIAVAGDTPESPAIEQAYRRGFTHGFSKCQELVKEGKKVQQLSAELKRLHLWRTRSIQQYRSAPGDKEKLPIKLFGGRVSLSPKLRYSIFKRDRFCCVICGRKASIDLTLEVDHIVPVAKGGSDKIENLQTLCFECNSGKSDSD